MDKRAPDAVSWPKKALSEMLSIKMDIGSSQHKLRLMESRFGTSRMDRFHKI